MNKKRTAIGMMAVILLLSGCQWIGKKDGEGPSASAYEKIQKNLVNLESYKSEATVEYKSNKGSNVYDTVQQCTIDGKYHIEVVGPDNAAGNVTLSDGRTIIQYNRKINGKISVASRENQERSEIFVTSFIKNYLSSQEVSIAVGSFDQGVCTILEAVIPGNHPYLATEKLWVDNQTYQPVKLVVYDQDQSERIVVTFKTFEYNVELDDSLFNMS